MSWQIELGDAAKLALPDQSVDLVFTSPPYCDARTYGIGLKMDPRQWIDWMLPRVAECCRVSRGLVLINCAGVTRDYCYWPACEGLLYRWWDQGGQCWRPAHWFRYGIPGSGGKQWLRANTEYIFAFKGMAGELPWADNTANGGECKYKIGGAMSYRHADGRRKNARVGKRLKDRRAARPKLANPGNVIQGIPVGGGMMGHDLAHENEAPFPLNLAEWFIRSWCPPGGTVCDPFSGSGTTAHAAFNLGRNARCFDIRLSQVFLGRKRMREVERDANNSASAPAA